MTTNFSASGSQCQTGKLETMKAKVKRRLRLELEASGTEQKALAIETGLDEGQVSRMLNPACLEALPAHAIPGVTREMGPGFMQWMALQCGGTYQHGVAQQPLYAAPAVLIGLLAHQSGDVVQECIQDLQDNHWSPEEKAARIPSLRKLVAIAATLLADAEGGVQ